MAWKTTPAELKKRAQLRKWQQTPNGKASCRRNARKRQQRWREWLNTVKLERGCADCGYNASPVALEFDHRDGTPKRYNVGAMNMMSKEKTLVEIAKCDVVCANCHAIRTHVLRKNEQILRRKHTDALEIQAEINSDIVRLLRVFSKSA